MGVTLALFLAMTVAGLVSANTGSITSSQNCSGGAVHVWLDNNVSADHKVTVTSTIPGFTATGITDKSYDTTGNAGPVEIWSASGPQPFAGTVTLTIKFSNGSVEATYTKTMTAQDPCPAPGFTVDKGVSLSADGPFVASLTTTTGTTVHYRITITNTGNVALTGVTLSDDTFDLAAKGCTVPTSLAVGAHYDCDYPSTAVTGTTTNVATGDTNQTGPDTGTATVVANPAPAPGFTVDKGVSLSADGPFIASLMTTTGTTVHYRITITNTGNVELTGVTLSDNTFDLAAKGCTVPTTLAVGAHYDCDYPSTAVTGTTTNVATGDTEQTGPDTGTAEVIAGGGGVGGETHVPTAPPTDAMASTDVNQPGASLPLLLAVLALLATSIGFVATAPATARRRDRR